MKTILSYVLVLLTFVTLTFLPNSFAQQVPFANVPFDTTNIPEPVPPPAAVRDFFQLDSYYQQWINVRGFPVLASSEVSPYTVKEAAWTIGHMIGHRPDILRAMAQNEARFSIVPHNKHLPEIPEYDFGRLNFFWEIRARGIGGLTTTSPEENIICGDRNYCYAELIHEFAHQLHNWGLNRVDPTFDRRLETLYNMAKKEGLYQDRYAGSNRWEYWAEGVGSWFNGPHPDNVAHTRSALKEYDPRLAGLLTEVFGDGSWRYTPPATRTHLPHLQGFNPQEAPIYQRPTRLLELEAQLRDPNSDGDGKWGNLKLHDPSELPRLLNSAEKNNSNRTDFLFVNLTGTDLSLYFFHVDGKKSLYQHSTTDDGLHVSTWVGAIWLIQDHTGKDFAVFRAEEQVGRVLIDIASIGPPPKVVSIPDPNLAAVIRTELKLTIDGAVTDRAMQTLKWLNLDDQRITNIDGLEYATQLQGLLLGKNQVNNYAPLAQLPKLTTLYLWTNSISDLNVLPILPQLELLDLNWNHIRDVSRLAGFTKLTILSINGNKINDVSPLAGLTNLRSLSLTLNKISDVRPLIGLTNLETLHIHGNPIKSQKPLLEMLRRNPNVKIYLKEDGDPLPVTLSSFRAEHTDTGVELKWITESEVDNAGFYIYRSETRDGEFKVVNPTMIQGAGTTSERNAYTWTDTTAKPNIAYYYQIEDISHAGVRKKLATVRMRGLVSASGKLTTRWADLKLQE